MTDRTPQGGENIFYAGYESQYDVPLGDALGSYAMPVAGGVRSPTSIRTTTSRSVEAVEEEQVTGTGRPVATSLYDESKLLEREEDPDQDPDPDPKEFGLFDFEKDFEGEEKDAEASNKNSSEMREMLTVQILRELYGEIKSLRTEKKKKLDDDDDRPGKKNRTLQKFTAGNTEDKLPTAKTWTNWIKLKLLSWCSLQKNDFDLFVENVILTDSWNPAELERDFKQANKDLAYDMCAMIDDTTSNFISQADRKCGITVLMRIHRLVMRTSSERTALLHERFEEPPVCKKKESLSYALAQWKADLEELYEARSRPSRETAMKALKKILSGVDEVKVKMELTEDKHPGDLGQLYLAMSQKASGWSTIAHDPRINKDRGRDPGKGGGGKGDRKAANQAGTKDRSQIPCHFFPKGTCHQGKQCPFSHAKASAGGDGGGGGKTPKGKGKGKGKTPKGQ